MKKHPQRSPSSAHFHMAGVEQCSQLNMLLHCSPLSHYSFALQGLQSLERTHDWLGEQKARRQAWASWWSCLLPSHYHSSQSGFSPGILFPRRKTNWVGGWRLRNYPCQHCVGSSFPSQDNCVACQVLEYLCPGQMRPGHWCLWTFTSGCFGVFLHPGYLHPITTN